MRAHTGSPSSLLVCPVLTRTPASASLLLPRRFEKTIRYASRKAYAEVRPRIKGRFAKKEEVEAWRQAEIAMKGSSTAMDSFRAADSLVPVL